MNAFDPAVPAPKNGMAAPMEADSGNTSMPNRNIHSAPSCGAGRGSPPAHHRAKPSPLEARINAGLARGAPAEVVSFAARLAHESDACAVLFYGSNMRTGLLEGVLDFYVLTPSAPERGIWPRVTYREWAVDGQVLRAKIATMSCAKFREAASGALLDTTIWTRFVQPSALLWCRDEAAESAVSGAVVQATMTAARLAAVLGPAEAAESAYWLALFEATYRAEFRIETTCRAHRILEMNREHFSGLLPLALDASGLGCARTSDRLVPRIGEAERKRVSRWWATRWRMGKALNIVRLLYASFTFDGAARYAIWKIERHSGVKIELTPWRTRHPVLAAPGVLWSVFRDMPRPGDAGASRWFPRGRSAHPVPRWWNW